MPLRLLLIEDSEDDALLLVRELCKGGYAPDFARVDTPQDLEAALDENTWDAVIADYNMPSFTGLDALRIIQAKGLDLPFILVSGVIGEEKAAQVMKAGAHDYIMKGNFLRLAPALERELRDAVVRRERRQALEALHRTHAELEQRVVERTAELQAAHTKLLDSRRAALNMMEDAVAARRLAEEANAELERTHEDLRQSKLAAEAATRAKSQFLANMSHELRTPMTGVLGMLDLALAGNLEVEQREFIEMAQTSARSLVRIINDILDLTKIEMGKLSLEEKPFCLRKCLESTFNIFLPVARNKGLDLSLTVANDVPETLVGDQTRLSQVLTNLVGNAVKFTATGKVEIGVTAGGSAAGGKRDVTFTVADSGIGIPDDKKDLLFRVFSQVDTSHSREYGGTGLGLAISKEIVERMGGRITFTSEAGKGSTFSCTIPLGVAAAEQDAIFASGKTATTDDVSRDQERTRPRLLIAEDDPIISQVLRAMLQRSNYDLDFVENGQKTVEMWERGEYDLILMDVQMPRLNGFEATAVIREKECRRGGHIPIIAMTAHALKEDEERCLAAGMDAYISKPIDFQKSLLVIAETLKIHNFK